MVKYKDKKLNGPLEKDKSIGDIPLDEFSDNELRLITTSLFLIDQGDDVDSVLKKSGLSVLRCNQIKNYLN